MALNYIENDDTIRTALVAIINAHGFPTVLHHLENIMHEESENLSDDVEEICIKRAAQCISLARDWSDF